MQSNWIQLYLMIVILISFRCEEDRFQKVFYLFSAHIFPCWNLLRHLLSLLFFPFFPFLLILTKNCFLFFDREYIENTQTF